MPRFFFDFDLGGGTLADDEGVELADLAAAEHEGVLALAEMSSVVFSETPRRTISLEIRQYETVLLRLTLALDSEAIGASKGQRGNEQP